VPCTLGYRSFVRDGRLHMYTTMRSQHLWLGLPYDIFATTLLQELLAGWLGVEMQLLPLRRPIFERMVSPQNHSKMVMVVARWIDVDGG
jgi:hypothetical protein